MYFHGTPNEFQPGEVVLPGSEVGKDNQFSQRDRRDLVYIFSAASEEEGRDSRGWAFTEKGYIYLVAPIGPVEPDPEDRGHDKRWQCAMARVLKQVWPLVVPDGADPTTDLL
jgi:hypothetical protein